MNIYYLTIISLLNMSFKFNQKFIFFEQFFSFYSLYIQRNEIEYMIHIKIHNNNLSNIKNLKKLQKKQHIFVRKHYIIYIFPDKKQNLIIS